ncbi:MAG: chorismate synthase [Rhodothermales bacterium]|nr:chorismate synthase [Rhodothermales bacterium]
MLRYLTAGESHGRALSAIVEGLPAGVPVTTESIDTQLKRRWLGYGRGGRSKFEKDKIQILAGVRFGKSMGSPISLLLENNAFSKDRAGWPTVMSVDEIDEAVQRVTLPRPGHADLVGTQKYRFDDIRPVIERASARETAIRVAACTIARELLSRLGIHIGSHVLSIGSTEGAATPELIQQRDRLCSDTALELAITADSSDVRMIDESQASYAIENIKRAKKDGDSLGGTYEVVVTGLIAGLGSYVQWDRRLDGQLGAAILSIQGQKAVEIGEGISAAFDPGSSVHDPIAIDSRGFYRTANRAGGIEGGVTTGMPIIVRGFMKPIPTLISPLQTVDIETLKSEPTRYERSDVTSVPAASVVAESVVAMVIANAVLDKFGSDTLDELVDRFTSEKTRQRGLAQRRTDG